MDLNVEWLGRMRYREAWDVQRARHAARDADDITDTLLLVEHEPVLTLGRHARDEHIITPPDELARRGIEVIRVERGGEVTYHGPGPLVAYPIVRLRERPVLLRPFVRALELTMADVAARYGIEAAPRAGYPGVWVDPDGPAPRKLGALGLRIERGISYHGIALNITTRLEDFGLIDQIRVLADARGVGREALEVHMLYGIREQELRRLRDAGHPAYSLVAYGSAWYRWYMRRLAERPANVAFALRQLIP